MALHKLDWEVRNPEGFVEFYGSKYIGGDCEKEDLDDVVALIKRIFKVPKDRISARMTWVK